jgi:hypothetical protein
MPEPDLSQLLATAAALVLCPPEASALEALAGSRGIKLDPGRARQDFYDVLCVAQSGRYIPPYAHVLAAGRIKDGDWWHFPPPRFDGGDALMPWYEAVGFDPMQLDVDPMLKGPHRPLDNVGFILAYLAGLVASRDRDITGKDDADAIIANFTSQFLGMWVDHFCDLLAGSASPYLEAVAEAVREATHMVRERFPAVLALSVAMKTLAQMP